MWLLKFIMRRFGYFHIGRRWCRAGDKVPFYSELLGHVLATVDSKGGLYVCSTTDFPNDEE
jgi:hypothetical protein